MSEIKSKPTYTALKTDPVGRYHVLLGQGIGGAALVRLLNEMPDTKNVHVIFMVDSVSESDRAEQFRASKPASLHVFTTHAEALGELDRTLSKCVMGTRLYIAGSESFIGSSLQIATNRGLNSDEIQCAQCGSASRRVYCIHCRTSNEDVTTNIVRCAGCGRHLFVRDHYSRRLAAYMGFMIDAEIPGEVPPIEEVY